MEFCIPINSSLKTKLRVVFTSGTTVGGQETGRAGQQVAFLEALAWKREGTVIWVLSRLAVQVGATTALDGRAALKDGALKVGGYLGICLRMRSCLNTEQLLLAATPEL